MPTVTNRFPRLIRGGGALSYLRGSVGNYIGAVGRDTLIRGTYAAMGPTGHDYTTGVGGSYTAATAGIYGPSSLTSASYGSNLVFATNGQIIANTDFYRRISVTAKNVTFINCRFWGSTTENVSCVTASNSNVDNLSFIDCTFYPQAPQYGIACFAGGPARTTFTRCDFAGGIDGAGNGTPTSATDMRFYGCYYHDRGYFSPDPSAAGGVADNASHSDGVQFRGGSLTIDGCNIQGFYNTLYAAGEQPVNVAWPDNPASGTPPYHVFGNKYVDSSGNPDLHSTSCIIFSPNLAALGNIIITNSVLDGSTWPVNINTSYTTATSFTFTNNKIGTDHRNPPGAGSVQAIICNTALNSIMTVTGNVRLDNGAALSKTDLLKAG